MSARLFVAVDLTDGARTQLAEAAARLRASLGGAGMDGAFRWVAPANLHITLRFLGEVDDAIVPAIEAAMSPDLHQAPARVTLTRPGTFPRSGRPRVLHSAIAAGAPLLGSLRDQVDARLAGVCAWGPDTRPFAPHVTLARARDRARLDPAAFRAVLDSLSWPEVAMEVTHVTLFRSVTRPSGPEYSVLARAGLGSS